MGASRRSGAFGLGFHLAEAIGIDTRRFDSILPGHQRPQHRGHNQTVKQQARADRIQENRKQEGRGHRADLGDQGGPVSVTVRAAEAATAISPTPQINEMRRAIMRIGFSCLGLADEFQFALPQPA